jgi:hypothetical protein
MEIGDFIRGKSDNERYDITNSKMTCGVITKVYNNISVRVKILKHENEDYIGKVFDVECKYFEVIGHVKPFKREDILELLKSGCKKAILDYNLSEANLDYSCLPLRCGGLKWRIDKRIACQLAYHLCSMQCEDEEFIRLRNLLLPFANQFHRVKECGKLLPIEQEEKI